MAYQTKEAVKMIITVKSVKNRHFRRILEHVVYVSVIFVLIPAFCYFELCVVLPAVVDSWTEQLVHLFNAAFLLMNIVGNLIHGVFTDTSIRGRMLDNKKDETWELCAVCECYRPPRAWHCETCNICILKRDHHCPYFAACVGYYNFRYFLMFTMHIFISMVYSFCYNVKYVALFMNWNHGIIILKFLFPLVGLVFDYGPESVYVFLVIVNFFVVCFTGFLFFYHLRNILIGRTVPENNESNRKKNYDKGWKLNLVEGLGQRWYLTWILPFIHSPLPGNGIEWDIEDKDK